MKQIWEKEAPTKAILNTEVQNKNSNCGKINMNSTERNGELLRKKCCEEKEWAIGEVSWWPQDFKNLCKRTSELERQMKEEGDEKNNKTAETGPKEGVWANGREGRRRWNVFERQEREETHRQEREEMREICEGEARDEEERNPDEGDSPHHGLKDRWR